MDGVLVANKKKGLTSHDVVDFVRKKFRIKKVGHAGSLDPIATGVLVLLLGKATKLSDRFIGEDKTYEVSLKLGISTDTLDAEGKVRQKKDTALVSKESIKEVFDKFQGEQWQKVPSYSATKYRGTPLYKWARRGISIQKEPRKINIRKLTIEKINIPEVSFKVDCSKGTYIRQLCGDIGDELGCGSHMTALRRISSGNFRIENAVSLDELEKMSTGELETKLLHFE